MRSGSTQYRSANLQRPREWKDPLSRLNVLNKMESQLELPLNTPSRPLAPRGGNDMVYTPSEVAELIVDHFRPSGRIVEPCRGGGAFTNYLPKNVDWFEIREGRDWLQARRPIEGRWDWCITNPPYSQFRPFLRKAMELCDNIVFLCFVNAMWMKARRRDMREFGFGIREILELDTPPPPWPQAGFQLAAIHLMRGWRGCITVSQVMGRTEHEF